MSDRIPSRCQGTADDLIDLGFLSVQILQTGMLITATVPTTMSTSDALELVGQPRGFRRAEITDIDGERKLHIYMS